jgi:hypothetical protein
MLSDSLGGGKGRSAMTWRHYETAARLAAASGLGHRSDGFSVREGGFSTHLLAPVGATEAVLGVLIEWQTADAVTVWCDGQVQTVPVQLEDEGAFIRLVQDLCRRVHDASVPLSAFPGLPLLDDMLIPSLDAAVGTCVCCDEAATRIVYSQDRGEIHYLGVCATHEDEPRRAHTAARQDGQVWQRTAKLPGSQPFRADSGRIGVLEWDTVLPELMNTGQSHPICSEQWWRHGNGKEQRQSGKCNRHATVLVEESWPQRTARLVCAVCATFENRLALFVDGQWLVAPHRDLFDDVRFQAGLDALATPWRRADDALDPLRLAFQHQFLGEAKARGYMPAGAWQLDWDTEYQQEAMVQIRATARTRRGYWDVSDPGRTGFCTVCAARA